MQLGKQFGVDKKKEVDGVWSDIGEGASVLVARAGNKKYAQALRRRMKPYKRRLQRDDPTMEKIAEKILAECQAEFVLLDWKGVQDDKGKKLSYSPAVGADMFIKYPEFSDLIADLSDDIEAYRTEEVAETVKN